MTTPLALDRPHKTVADLRFGDVIVERNERGRIIESAIVMEASTGCTDPSNVHLHVRVSKTPGVKVWCYFGGTVVEVKP